MGVQETKALEDQMIQKGFDVLLKDYLQSNHRRKTERITKAFHFANQAHAGAKRRSGEPYIMHPLAVARIVCTEMGLGSTSICSALLHDVVEDTEYTVEDINNMFGSKIAQIVDGLTKISGGIFGEHVSTQTENFRKLLLTMSDDIRVILIKIADRLHNMRTLDSMLPNKQYKIAGETIYLYAPLAHRLGLFTIKTELEDLSFKYEHPEQYKLICDRLHASEETRTALFNHFKEPVEKKLNDMGLNYEMKARAKSVYSIWNKMELKGVDFKDIYDIYAVRIIFDPLPDISENHQCWDIYSAITGIYRTRPDRIRDWINHPKTNGYQALHLTVMGPDGEWIEIQIRSRRMDEIAEKGFAAHWKYKYGEKPAEKEEDTELNKWLHTITEILENPSPDALDFLDTIKLNLYTSEIFVFTPKGDIKTLPQGATALDFAYDLHTDIGNSCIGAKVNHRLVPLSHPLNSGDQVEILTSRSQKPQIEWLNFVTTARAHSKIDAILKKARKEAAKKGEEKVSEVLRQAGQEANLFNTGRLSACFGFVKRDDFFHAVEKGDIPLQPENIKKLLKEKHNFVSYVKQAFGGNKQKKEKDAEKTEKTKKTEGNVPAFDKSQPYILREEENSLRRNYIIAECCKPVPGDEALGFLDKDNNVEVHKRSCPDAIRLKSSFGERIVNTQWSNHETASFEATLEVKGIDSIGVLNAIAKTISEYNVNIHNLSMDTKDGMFKGKIQMNVHDVDDIQQICLSLSKLDKVQSVSRVVN